MIACMRFATIIFIIFSYNLNIKLNPQFEIIFEICPLGKGDAALNLFVNFVANFYDTKN